MSLKVGSVVPPAMWYWYWLNDSKGLTSVAEGLMSAVLCGGELFMKPLSSLDMLSMLEAYDEEELSPSVAANGDRRAMS